MSKHVCLYPLLSSAGDIIDVDQCIVAYRRGESLTARRFLSDVEAVRQYLANEQAHGDAKHCLNVCGNRYNIAVLLAACMLTDCQSLLPPNTAPETLRKLQACYAKTIMITDTRDRSDAQRFSGAIHLSDILSGSAQGQTEVSIPVIASDRLIGTLFTSGSTGEPMPIARHWGALCQSVRAESVALQLAPGTALLATVPAQHSYGLESSLALALQNGHAIAADESFYPADIIASLQALPQPRALITTPFHLRLLLDSGETMPAVDLVVSATAPLAPQLAHRAEAAFSAPVREIYGCTESGQIACRQTTIGSAWTLFPRLILAQRVEDGSNVTYVSGGHVGPETRLGDAIELRGSSEFLLYGRLGDMINIAGKRSSLAHLNFQLNSIDGVEDGIFIAPDDAAIEADGHARLSAFTVAPTLTERVILQALRERLDPVFLPRPLRLVNSIPRNATGKVTKETIAELMKVAS